MRRSNHQKYTGQQLVATFQTVLVSQATIEAASYDAKQSESDVLEHLQQVGSNGYLQPSVLNGRQDDFSRASLNAHIKKVQADQLQAMSQQQLLMLQAESEAVCKGKKITVTVLSSNLQPVDTIWFDERNGYRSSIAKKQTYHGVITDVVLQKNLLVIKPPALLRAMNNSLHSYAVYVIDPQTGMPMVDIHLG